MYWVARVTRFIDKATDVIVGGIDWAGIGTSEARRQSGVHTWTPTPREEAP